MPSNGVVKSGTRSSILAVSAMRSENIKIFAKFQNSESDS